MLKFKKVKSCLVVLSIMGVSVLTGCNEAKKTTQTEVENAATEVVSEIQEPTETMETTVNSETSTTEEIIEETEKEVAKEIESEEELKYFNLAAESYNMYPEFYTSIGMAQPGEDKTPDISRIEEMVKCINGDVAGLSSAQIFTAKENIEHILLSNNLEEDLNYISKGELTKTKRLYNNPVISQFVKDENTRNLVRKYEILRDKVINEINSANGVTQETKEELKNLFIEYDIEEKTTDKNDVGSEASMLVNYLTKRKIVELIIHTTGEYMVGDVQLDAMTDEQHDIKAKFLINNKNFDALTDEEKKIYTDMQTVIAVEKYDVLIGKHLDKLVEYAKGNTNISSKINELKQYREVLVAYKNENQENKVYTM